MNRSASCVLFTLALLAGVVRPALADPVPSGRPTVADDPRAREFFEVGQQAYGKGQYLLAIDAFEQAYAIVQRPGLLFSLGQAHQRQFRAKAEGAHLQAALDYYRRYLEADATGRRRSEALAAIESLARIAEQLLPGVGGTPAIFGKLLVSSSTPDATVAVDGEGVDTLPASLELPANHYRVEAKAPGFAPQKREVSITPGVTVPLNFELQPLPSALELIGPIGAEAFVDGRPIGFLPTGKLSLPAGEHWLSLREPGHNTLSRHVDLRRGETTHTELELETTTQRKAAWTLGAGSGATVLLTGVFAGLALARDQTAKSLDARRQSGELTRDEGSQLNAAVDSRDRYRAWAIVGGVSTAALLGAALVLYVSDTPAPPDMRSKPTSEKPRPLELDALVSPGVWVGQVTQRF